MLKHSELHRDVRLQAAGAGNLTQGCRHWLALSSQVKSGPKRFYQVGQHNLSIGVLVNCWRAR